MNGYTHIEGSNYVKKKIKNTCPLVDRKVLFETCELCSFKGGVTYYELVYEREEKCDRGCCSDYDTFYKSCRMVCVFK